MEQLRDWCKVMFIYSIYIFFFYLISSNLKKKLNELQKRQNVAFKCITVVVLLNEYSITTGILAIIKKIP